MTYEIIYSPEALDDLRSIYKYIAFVKLAPEKCCRTDKTDQGSHTRT